MKYTRILQTSLLAGLCLLFLAPLGAWAQEGEEGNSGGSVDPLGGGPSTIELDDGTVRQGRRKLKQKKPPKTQWYGIKTKRGYEKQGFGGSMKLKLFYYLKDWEEPNPYVPDIYWFDLDERKIKVGGKINKENGRLLHGPYTVKNSEEQILEEGVFYHGLKHGRWTEYTKDDILVEKYKFMYGWPKESEITYWDKEETKVKEVIPVVFGEKEGQYFYFFENGEIAVSGRYKYDKKIGRWREYWSHRHRLKKEVIYPTDPYSTEAPFVNKEWNERGRVVYDAESWRRKLKQN